MSQQAPLKIYASVDIRYKNGDSTHLEHVVHQIQVTPAGIVLMFEQPRGEQVVVLVNMAEVTDIHMVPSKVELA